VRDRENEITAGHDFVSTDLAGSDLARTDLARTDPAATVPAGESELFTTVDSTGSAPLSWLDPGTGKTLSEGWARWCGFRKTRRESRPACG
jgi:hypothetical protein